MINASAELKRQHQKAINVYQLDEIVKLWGWFDNEGLGFMNYKDFWKFTSKIAKILGLQTEQVFNLEEKKKFLDLLELPVYEHKTNKEVYCFYFYDVVLTITKIAVVIKMGLKQFQFSFNIKLNVNKGGARLTSEIYEKNP